MDWSLFDMDLGIGDVALRPVTDADLPAIDAMFPDDDEQDPDWEHFTGLRSNQGSNNDRSHRSQASISTSMEKR